MKNVSKGNAVPKLAARSLIVDLEEGRSYLHDNSGNLLSGKLKEDVVKEIVRLSTRYIKIISQHLITSQSILSKHTAFVAIEKRDEATEGTMQIVNIPMGVSKASVKEKVQHLFDLSTNSSSSASASSGYGGLLADDLDELFTPPPLARRSSGSSDGSFSESEESDFMNFESLAPKSENRAISMNLEDFSLPKPSYDMEKKGGKKAESQTKDKPVPDNVINIIMKQKFDGSWALDSLVMKEDIM